MQPIPLPAPYAGVDELTPVIALESPFCENLLNYNLTRAGAILRNGDSILSFLAIGSRSPKAIGVYSESVSIAVLYTTNTAWYFYNANTEALLLTDAGAVSGGSLVTPFRFNNRLFFFINSGFGSPGYVYDGATVAALGYTGSGFSPLGGVAYKGRPYIAESGEAAYWYGDIGQITGALTKIDLTTVVSDSSDTLTAIGTVTLADNVSTVALIAFIFASGEVLFYSGSYPNSATWALAGTASIGKPTGPRCTIAYQGDTIVLTETGVFSLRELFLKGAEGAQDLSINSRIQKSWTALVETISSSLLSAVNRSQIRGVWDKVNGRLVISLPGYLSLGALVRGSYYFIFNTELKSWYFHRSQGVTSTGFINDICYQNNKVLLLGDSTTGDLVVWSKEGATGFTDRSDTDAVEQPFSYEVKSAPVSTGRAYVSKAAGLDVIVNSDLYAETDYNFVCDLGVQTTTSQKVNGVSGSLQKPFVNIGIEGSYIQYKISGTTVTGKTVGYQLYGVNLWQDSGTSPR